MSTSETSPPYSAEHGSSRPEAKEHSGEFELSIIAAAKSGGDRHEGRQRSLTSENGIDIADSSLRGVLSFTPGEGAGYCVLVTGSPQNQEDVATTYARGVLSESQAYLDSLNISSTSMGQDEAQEKLVGLSRAAQSVIYEKARQEGALFEVSNHIGQTYPVLNGSIWQGATLMAAALFKGSDGRAYLGFNNIGGGTAILTKEGEEGDSRIIEENPDIIWADPGTKIASEASWPKRTECLPLTEGKYRLAVRSNIMRGEEQASLPLQDNQTAKDAASDFTMSAHKAAKVLSEIDDEEFFKHPPASGRVINSHIAYVIDFEVKKKQSTESPKPSVAPQHPDDEPLVVKGRAVPASERVRVRRENIAAGLRRERAFHSLNVRKFARGIMRYAIYTPFVAGQNWRWQAMSAEEYSFSSRSRKVAAAVGGVASKALLIGGLSYFMKNGWHMPDMPNMPNVNVNPFDNDHSHKKPSPTPSAHPTQSPTPEATEPKPSASPSPEKTHPGSGEGGQPPQQDHSPHPADKPDLKAERVEVKSRTWSQGADEGRLSVEEQGAKIIISAQGMNHDPTQANITIDHHQYVVDLDTNGEVVIDKHTALGHILEGNDFDTVEVGDFDAKNHAFHAYATEIGSGDASAEQVTDTNLGQIDVAATESNMNRELAQAGVHDYKVDIAKQGDLYIATLLDSRNQPVTKNGQPVIIAISGKELAGTEGVTSKLIEKIKSHVK